MASTLETLKAGKKAVGTKTAKGLPDLNKVPITTQSAGVPQEEKGALDKVAGAVGEVKTAAQAAGEMGKDYLDGLEPKNYPTAKVEEAFNWLKGKIKPKAAQPANPAPVAGE